MTQLFGHEKLKVYQKGMDFAAIRSTLPERVAAPTADGAAQRPGER